MTEAEFAHLRRFLKVRSGLELGPDQRYLAQARLMPVCRAAGLASVGELTQRLKLAGEGTLERNVVEAMTTHETFFFRDRKLFEALRQDILPELIARRARTRRLRIWSAATSTGQEAYSVAMLLAHLRTQLDGWTVEVFGTDISSCALERAAAGSYSTFEVQRGLPVLDLLRFFDQTGLGWTVKPELRNAVTFRVLNLLDDFRALGTFDLVLCRNVLFYMAAATRDGLLDRLAGALAADGALCLGASESILGKGRPFQPHPTRRELYVRAATRSGPARLRAGG